MLVVGYDVPSSQKAVEIASTTAGVVSAVGVHPHDAASVEDGDLAALRALAAHETVVAIGETGLDFYRNLSSQQAQRSAFERHLDLGEELGLPVIIHCREAQDELLAGLEARQPSAVIWHAFEGNETHARRAADLGSLFGFGGLLTRTGGDQLKQVVRELPAERILLETDSPYLLPTGGARGDNEPANLPLIVQIVAEARGESASQVVQTAAENACHVFRLCPDSGS
jgi:TatD DNase family protein